MLELGDGSVTLRPLKKADASPIAQLINNRKIWDNLRDIPYPYHLKDAEAFIELSSQQVPVATFGIFFKGELCGVIGLIMQKDIYRLSAEVGYWIGEPFWGKGLATKSLSLITDYAFSELGLNRLYAGAFAHNEASRKVLEKCGYQREGIAKNAIIKNNQILDEYKYAILKSDFLN
ncbi:GNAT family N-acetyltransferase [Ekhidna sp. To15]|uniref:GNAT family N-acetyltransferase n=1 Tax=Ekhidna sp. To15 TaxID=3395267 RepID=UPI003F524910